MQLICYLSNGYPSIEDTVKRCGSYVKAGADVIEVDLPARDPYMESAMIADRMSKALSKTDNYDEYLNAIQIMKTTYHDKKFLMVVYEDTINEIGVEKYTSFCVKNNILDVIVVGSKDKNLKEKLIEQGICVSCYVQFHMPQSHIEDAIHSNGFIYLQAKPTHDNINPKYSTLKSCIDYLRSVGITRDIYCGVGVHTVEDVAMVRQAGASGVFVGKAILDNDSNEESLMTIIQEFKKATE